MEENLSKGYTILWEQYIQPLKNKLKAEDEYAIMDIEKNVIKLAEMVSNICNSTSTIRNFTTRILEANYYLHYVDGNDMKLSRFINVFMEKRKVAEACE